MPVSVKIRPYFNLSMICLVVFLGLFPVLSLRADEETTDGQLENRVADPIGALYDEAMRLYKEHRYVEAKEKLLQVQAISPDAYPSSKAFLKRIDQHLAQQEADLKETQRKQELLERKKAQHLQELKASRQKQFDELQHVYRQERVKRQKLAVAQRMVTEKDLATRGKTRYRNILALYKAKRYIEAKDQVKLLKRFLDKYEAQFAEGFKAQMAQKADAAEKLIESAEQRDKVIKKEKESRAAKVEEQRQSRTLRVKQQAELKAEQKLTKEREEAARKAAREQREQEKKARQLAKQRMDEAQKTARPKPAEKPTFPIIDMEISKTAPRPIVAQTKKGELELERRQLKEKLTHEVEALYQDGTDFYRTEQWTLAKNVFVEVDKLWPNYKSTRNYLRTIDQRMNPAQIPQPAAKSREELIKEALDEYR